MTEVSLSWKDRFLTAHYEKVSKGTSYRTKQKHLQNVVLFHGSDEQLQNCHRGRN